MKINFDAKNFNAKKIKEVLTRPIFYTAKKMLGLDIGSRFVKLVEIEQTLGGYELKNIGIKELPLDVIVDGEVMDTDTLVDVITSFVEECETEEKSVALMVSGRDVLVKAIETEIKERELSKKKEDIARANIPYDIEDVCFDTMVLKGTPGNLVMAAAKNEKIYSLLGIVQEVGLTPVMISTVPIVIERVCETNGLVPEEGVYMVVSVGDDRTDVVLMRNGIFEKYGDIGMGVDTYLKDIAREHAIPVDEGVPILLGEEAVSKGVTKTISTDTRSIIKQITGFLKTENAKCDGIILMGEGATIPGLRDAFESSMGVNCKIGNPFERISTKETVELPNRFDVATGLAITGLQRAGVNLLPVELRPKEEKKILATLKGGFPLWAGVIMFLVLTLMYIVAGFSIRDTRTSTETLKIQQKSVRKRMALLEDLKNKRREVKKRIQIMQGLKGGKYSRVKFMDEINRVIPPYTWLTLLKEEGGGKKNFGVLIKGITGSNLGVSEFLKRLENSIHFSSVELSYTQKSQVRGVDVTEFEIRTNFQE